MERRTLASRETEKPGYELSEEVAEDQLILFLDFYEIRENKFYTADEKTVYQHTLQRLLEAVRLGRLTFHDDGTVSQTLRDKRKITYQRLKGKAKLQNRAVRNESEDAMRTRRQYSIMASLSGLGINDIAEFEAIDLGVVECLSFLLSSV